MKVNTAAGDLILQPGDPLARATSAARAGTPTRQDWLLVLALCAGQVLLWSLAFGLSYKAPEIDSAEQFVWSFSLENGYWKHPPMPSWIMHALLQVFGPSVVLPFVATQICTVTALALTWRLGCEFMSPRRSLIAMALTSLVAYHNIGADSFNHSTALLPFQIAMVTLFYFATRRGTWTLWAATGLLAGLAMLVKYVALMPIAGMLLYFLLDRQLHQRRALLGLALAAAVLAMVLLPHALWLGETDYLPFRYARSMSLPLELLPRLQNLGGFVMVQALRLLPMLLGLAYVLRGAMTKPVMTVHTARGERDRLFLWVAATAPLALTVAFAVASGTGLHARWGSNLFLLAGLAAMTLVNRVDTARMLRRTLGTVIGVHLFLSVGMTLGKTVVADHFHWRTRANFPGPLLASKASEVWKAHSSAPLRIVVSDIWLGGNIIANSPNRIAVLIDGHLFKSPWVPEQAVRDCGALVLDDQTAVSGQVPGNSPALDALMGQASATGTWNLPWAVSQRQATDGATGVVRWGVITPLNAAACRIK